MAEALSPLSEGEGLEQPFNETSYDSPERTAYDGWAESPERSAASTQGSPWRSTNPFRTKLGQSRSLPSLQGTWYSHSPHTSSWYSSHSPPSISSPTRSQWSPLGSTWRDREKDDSGIPIRKNPDEGNAFAHGCIPNWSKINVRKAKTLEHELTWAYYKMSRHALHPERAPVGDPHMPNEHVVEPMRSGSKFKFQFWRDLKPPFLVQAVRRAQSEDRVSDGKHPDGELFYVSYSCGIDYVGERLWNEKSEGGTFDNKIKGVASVRIPDGFPKHHGNIHVINWGRPSLNAVQVVDPSGEPLEDGFIDPNKWMPISDELQQRANMPRFARCRESTRQAHAGIKARRSVEVAPLQKLLLGPHASLPRLAAMTDALDPPCRTAEGTTPSPKKQRQHRIFTAAGGFVTYAG